jgi:hypothetical protein
MPQPASFSLASTKQLDNPSLVGIDDPFNHLRGHLSAPLSNRMKNLVDVYFSVL